MNKIATWTLAIFLTSVSTLTAAENGFVSMFDGKSLTGWKINEKPESWKVEDGKIIANGKRSHLFYVGDEKPFVDFVFRAEVMTKPNSNAGIYFHTKYQEQGWPKQGHEAQINNTFHRDPQKTGSLYNTAKVAKAPANDNVWFAYEIRVEGLHVVIKIDGNKVVDFTQQKGKKGPVHLSRGTFALQAHDAGSTVYFRNIRVKRLLAAD